MKWYSLFAHVIGDTSRIWKSPSLSVKGLSPPGTCGHLWWLPQWRTQHRDYWPSRYCSLGRWRGHPGKVLPGTSQSWTSCILPHSGSSDGGHLFHSRLARISSRPLVQLVTTFCFNSWFSGEAANLSRRVSPRPDSMFCCQLKRWIWGFVILRRKESRTALDTIQKKSLHSASRWDDQSIALKL